MDFGFANDSDDDLVAVATPNDKGEEGEEKRIEEKRIEDLTVKEMKSKLQTAGLRTIGNKEALIERLLHPERETQSQLKNGIAHDLLTAGDILRLGLQWVNIGEERQSVREALNISRFKSFFGVEPVTIKDAYTKFIDLCDDDDIGLKEFLMLVEWLKKCKVGGHIFFHLIMRELIFLIAHFLMITQMIQKVV